jgi:UDP-perosamine 4-acetyltransferase
LAVLGGDEFLDRSVPDEFDLLLGVGQVVRRGNRERLYRVWSGFGYAFPSIVHPTAWVAPDVVVPDGTQVMAGAVIQPGCAIGRNTIVNTRAGIDHDCRIGANVHIAPGVVLCGGVEVGDGAFIGAGAVLIQGVKVGRGAVVGAGVTLVRDLAPYLTVVGAANRHLSVMVNDCDTSESNPLL